MKSVDLCYGQCSFYDQRSLVFFNLRYCMAGTFGIKMKKKVNTFGGNAVLYLGSVIREHRIKKGLTQEQLGQELGVSTQCISRWENGVTFPDIMMLPIIADFFEITIDQLMGRTRECSPEEREAFFSDIQQLEVDKRIERLREALQLYPQDIYFMFSLANNLNQMVKTQSTYDERIELEIDILCHKLLCSNNSGMQCGALYLLALKADRHGDKAAAMKYVNDLPSMYVGREIMAERILNGLSFRQAVKKMIKL